MHWSERVETFALKNGLKVHYQTYPENVAGIALLYRAGSAHEKVGKTGIAHILEHLMFNGTSNYGPFSDYVEAWGGTDNAFTDRDITVYHTVVPAERLWDVLALEADRMLNLTFNNFYAEKSVILEEYLLSENEDDERLWTETFAALWPDSPYSHPVSGWPSDVLNLTLDDLLEFYRTHYTPNNALLVVVSPHGVEAVREMVEEIFGPLPRGPEVRHPVYSPPPYPWSKRIDVRMNRPRRFVLAFRLGKPSLRYNTALNVFSRILDLERSSPLWPLVEDGLLEVFNVRNYEYEGGNVFAVVGEVAPGRDVPYQKILDTLLSFSPSDRVLSRVKKMFKSEFIFSYEEAESITINVALTSYLFGDVPTLSESLKVYDSITSEDLEALKKEIEKAPEVLVRYV